MTQGAVKMQYPEGVNAYELLVEAAQIDSEASLALDLLVKAMEDTGVQDSVEAYKTVGDFVLRLSQVACESGEPIKIDTSTMPGLNAYVNTYERFIELHERFIELLEMMS